MQLPGVGVVSYGQSTAFPEGASDGDSEVSITSFVAGRNTPAIINSAEYQVYILASAESAVIAEFSVDQIQMEWFYDLPDPPLGSFGARNVVIGRAADSEGGGPLEGGGVGKGKLIG